MNKSFKERRKHVRIYRNFIMSYHEKGKSIIKHHVTQISNISKGGMSFTTTHPLNQGVVVTVDLKTLFVAGSIHLEGIVLNCGEKVPELIYNVRLKFLELTEKAVLALDKIEKYGNDKEG